MISFRTAVPTILLLRIGEDPRSEAQRLRHAVWWLALTIRFVYVLDEESESTVALRSSPNAVAFTAITHI